MKDTLTKMADNIPLLIPKGSELKQYKVGTAPPGARYVSENQLFEMTQKTLYKWHPSSEMYPLHYGGSFAGIAAGMTGFIFNSHFRKTFRLRNLGYGATFLPAVLVPAITATVFHEGFVKKGLLTRSFSCPVCAEIRAVSFQCCISNVQALVFAYLGCVSIARAHTTYKMPRLTDYSGQWTLIKKALRPLRTSYPLLLGINVVTAAVITYREGYLSEMVLSKVQAQILSGDED